MYHVILPDSACGQKECQNGATCLGAYGDPNAECLCVQPFYGVQCELCKLFSIYACIQTLQLCYCYLSICFSVYSLGCICGE